MSGQWASFQWWQPTNPSPFISCFPNPWDTIPCPSVEWVCVIIHLPLSQCPFLLQALAIWVTGKFPTVSVMPRGKIIFVNPLPPWELLRITLSGDRKHARLGDYNPQEGSVSYILFPPHGSFQRFLIHREEPPQNAAPPFAGLTVWGRE